jgi:putative chitinase
MYKIDINKFKQAFPECKNPNELCNLFDNILSSSGIDTKERVNMFLAQCGHESAGFTRFNENLNYSAKALRGVFGRYFLDDKIASEYERKPEKIANRVYANRMGNGSENSGDGWKYRGRGIIMTTGKSNYKEFSEYSGIDAVNNPDLLSTDISVAIQSAVWFWNKNNLNKYCDKNDFIGLTKRINGGLNGLADREDKLRKLM